MLGVAAALVGSWATGAGAQSVLTPMEAQRQFLSTQAVLDVPVEMAHWSQSTSIQWLYVVGWVTQPHVGGGSGTRMAVFRYNALDLDDNPRPAFYPPLSTSIGTDQYKATGIVVDPANGDVYICGEGTEASGTTDYFTIKLTWQLFPGAWADEGDGEGVRRFDGGLDDLPVDIVLAGTSSNQRVIVTGSKETTSAGDDYLTVAYDSGHGDLEWSELQDHEDGDDQPVEMAAWQVVGASSSDTPEGFYVAVAGTSYDSTTGRDFMVVRYFVADPTTPNTKKVGRYQPAGDDICTGIAPAKQESPGGAGGIRIAVSGSTTPDPTSPIDTAFVIATFSVDLQGWWNTTNSAVVWNPTENADIAVDVSDSGGVFWAAGNISLNADGDQHSIGIMAYLADSGMPSPVGTKTFNFGETDGLDATAANMFSVGTSAYIIGQHRDPNSDLVENYLVLKYDAINSLTALQLAAYGTYNGSTGMEHMGRAVGVYSGSGLFTTGTGGHPTTGIDWVTLRY